MSELVPGTFLFPRWGLSEDVFRCWQLSRIGRFFNIDIEFFDDGASLQRYPYADFISDEIFVDVQVVAKKLSRAAGENQVRGIQGQVPAIGEEPVDIDVVMCAFLEAVGVQVHENAVGLLCPYISSR